MTTDTLPESPDLAKMETELRAAMAASETVTKETAKPDTAAPKQAEPAKVEEVKSPTDLQTGTLAAADKEKQPDATKETQAKLDNRSEYAKNAERLDKTWKNVNEQKTLLEKQRQELAAKEKEIQLAEQRFEEKQAIARNRVTPEQNESYAKQKLADAKTLTDQAEAWEARVEKLEADGNFTDAAKAKDTAKQYRKQANAAEAMADLYTANAENQRKNPDQTAEQVRARNMQHLQHYTVEAAKNWPDIGVTGSEFQKLVNLAESQLRQNGLEVNETPILRYFVAEAVANKTAAASVPDLKKKLGEYEARVKELEALTAPGGGTGSVQRSDVDEVDFSKMTSAQQEAHLRKLSR